MSERDDWDRDSLRRQVEARLRSLGDAGVAFLPKVAPLVVRTRAVGRVEAGADSPEANMPDTLKTRRKALDVLADEVKACRACPELAATRTQTVFADGSIEAELCFIGEAPGADEDAQGKPFVGAAGQLLNRIIAACGLTREEVYICNTIKCRPPANRTPSPDEAANCSGFLERQLDLVKPKYIVCLGSTAATYLLGTKRPLGELRGKFHEYRGIPVMVTYHPAYLLPHRNPAKKKDVWEDMKVLLTKMGRPIPTPKKDEG